MGQQCSICTHPDRARIEKDLLAGVPMRTIADQRSVSKTALIRHRDAGHVSQRLHKSANGRELLESESLAEKVRTLERRTDVLYSDACELLEKAKAGNDTRAAVAAVNSARACIGESRELLRLCGELAGQLAPQGASVQVLAPILINVLSEANVGPEARAALAKRLMELDARLELPPA